MVNPAFSESQLKNLRRQNRHLASTHRRKLVFLQASRNPAHGSGRPFFVRDVPVPASFCPAFALPAPVSAAPQLRPFCRPHRFCPRLPASPARRTEFGFVLCALPFRFPARHPGNGPARHLSARLLSLQPSPLRLPALAAPLRLPALAAPQLRPFRRPLRFCPRLPASPARRTEFGFVLCALPFRIPARHPGNGPVPASFYSAFAPPAPVSAAPQLRPFCRPHRFCPRLPASALVFQPLPHAGQSSGPYCARCRSASPPGTPGTVPSDIFLPGLRPSGSRFRRSAVFALSRRGSAPPRGDRPNRLLLRPGTRKGLSDRSQTAPFLSVCYSGTSPNTQFSENWKNSSDGPLHSYSRSRTSPPPPNMPLKGSKNLPDSSVRSRIAQPADRLPAPAAAGLSSSSHRSSGSPDR